MLSLLKIQNTDTALTIVYFTIALITLTRLVDEWLYFKRYNVQPASALFIILLSILAFTGTYISRYTQLGGLSSSLIELNLNLLGGAYFIFLTTFEIIFALIFYVLLIMLLRRYHSGLYPLIFIYRRKSSYLAILTYNLILIGLLIWIWETTRVVNILELGFVLFTFSIIAQYRIFRYINWKRVYFPLQRGGRSSSRYQSRSLSPRMRRTVATSSNITRNAVSTNQLSNISRNQNLRSATSPQVSQNRVLRSGVNSNLIDVVPGISTSKKIKREKKKTKFTESYIQKLRPVGQNLSKDDFRCIFCYDFPVDAQKQTIICPHCHKASHEDEFRKWSIQSNYCSYCNKSLENISPVRIPGHQYSKVINAILKNNLKVN